MRPRVHRVVNTMGTDRYSMPFFIDLDFDVVVEPLPTCVTPGESARYAAFTCGEHKCQRFVDSYAHLRPKDDA